MDGTTPIGQRLNINHTNTILFEDWIEIRQYFDLLHQPGLGNHHDRFDSIKSIKF